MAIVVSAEPNQHLFHIYHHVGLTYHGREADMWVVVVSVYCMTFGHTRWICELLLAVCTSFLQIKHGQCSIIARAFVYKLNKSLSSNMKSLEIYDFSLDAQSEIL
jgi:hypothetical protein